MLCIGSHKNAPSRYAMKRNMSRMSDYSGKKSFRSDWDNALWQCLSGKKPFRKDSEHSLT